MSLQELIATCYRAGLYIPSQLSNSQWSNDIRSSWEKTCRSIRSIAYNLLLIWNEKSVLAFDSRASRHRHSSTTVTISASETCKNEENLDGTSNPSSEWLFCSGRCRSVCSFFGTGRLHCSTVDCFCGTNGIPDGLFDEASALEVVEVSLTLQTR